MHKLVKLVFDFNYVRCAWKLFDRLAHHECTKSKLCHGAVHVKLPRDIIKPQLMPDGRLTETNVVDEHTSWKGIE